ncbi:MAG TPA: ABC transporter ATP-binding protein [Thermodesulfovibrionales bacterium]|jgi:Fe-S cluster assembly ATP-binding protein|nr:ABC transporter ATP-binding protein [Thermodesulfovibrionales bacterium]
MLDVENLVVSVDGRRVLSGVNLSVDDGQITALFGPNGSGKTTLLKTIMGFPSYRVESGRVMFKGRDITALPMDERSRRGLGMAFQSPPVVRGVKLRDVLRVTMGKRGPVSEERIDRWAERLRLTGFLQRDINLGFSGGEVKRSELLQLLVQNPDLTMLDEPDSGVDLENIHLVGGVINELLGKGRVKEKGLKSALVITHSGYILDYVNPDKACVMLEGSIRCVGNPRDILREIREKGYEECVRCLSAA